MAQKNSQSLHSRIHLKAALSFLCFLVVLPRPILATEALTATEVQLLQTWQAAAAGIPKRSGTCLPNPVTRTCNRGLEILPGLEALAAERPSLAAHLEPLRRKFYTVIFAREAATLRLFLRDREDAKRRPLPYTIRANTPHDSESAVVHCVGMRQGPGTLVPGKCDVVPVAQLDRRILDQAILLESLALDTDKAWPQEVIRQFTQTALTNILPAAQ